MQKEAKARIKINKLLELAGWRFLADDGYPANIRLETHIRHEDLGDNFEHAKDGYADYLLLDGDFPICVLEAKSEDKDPLTAKEQTRRYANSLKVRFIILSNGNVHYFWDLDHGNPTRISYFPALETFKGRRRFSPDPDRLIKENVRKNYIVLTQNPYYQDDPRWKADDQREQYISDTNLLFLRDYQLEAVRTIQKAASAGKNRFLFEMATGTGKTLTAAAIIKLYLRTGNARRVLFLVDRLELENQAKKDLNSYLKPDFSVLIFKENRDDWQKAEIVITTIQSISYENKYLRLFSPTDFDLIISDEAHRSISGNSRVIFEYFIGTKLGLTATPKDYLKNLNEKQLAETDPREFERRVLLSTYKTFGCESGIPTFRYTLDDGAREGFLIKPTALDCRTEITTQLLSEEGYAVPVQTEEGDEENVIFRQKDFERKFFSDKTNAQFIQTFTEHALRDPVSGEIGKTIVFCVSRKHATKITGILNEFADTLYPGKYNSDFAVQITSDITSAQQMTISFANNNLNGHTRFKDGYKSSKTRVCVTVGMMTTGYDCKDILNLCLLRPIFSPTDFVQMRGRGTRTFTFKFLKREEGRDITEREKKTAYKLFDFFASCEYFEEKYPYDEVLKPPKEKGNSGGEDGPPTPPLLDTYTSGIDDPLKHMMVVKEAEEEWRIDRELYSGRFEITVKESYEKKPEFKDAVDGGDYEEMERFIKEHVFDKPEDYFNLEKLRKSYGLDRRLNLWEILDKIFGRILRFKTRDELAEEEFERFVVSTDAPPDKYYEMKEFFRLYLLDEEARLHINQKDFAWFMTDPEKTHILQTLGRERLKKLPDYIKDNVNLNRYLR